MIIWDRNIRVGKLRLKRVLWGSFIMREYRSARCKLTWAIIEKSLLGIVNWFSRGQLTAWLVAYWNLSVTETTSLSYLSRRTMRLLFNNDSPRNKPLACSMTSYSTGLSFIFWSWFNQVIQSSSRIKTNSYFIAGSSRLRWRLEVDDFWDFERERREWEMLL